MIICLDQRNGKGCGAQNPDGATHCSRCGQSLRHGLHLHNPGSIVEHYAVVHPVGYGSFGAVYEAEDLRRPGRLVALKESFDPDDINNFRREFGILQTISHPNLPEYYEIFETDGNGYLVMEFVPGQSLKDVQEKKQGPLLESQVLGYAMQLCDALRYLHSQHPPIIHRDIKPANIRITPEGLIKLVDFGLLKQGTAQHASVTRGGTPTYAALEQWSGGSDVRSDVYGLGSTLYHLLTGVTPVTAVERAATLPDPLPNPRQHNPKISQRVAGAIEQALALKQHERFPDVMSLQAALLGTDQATLQSAYASADPAETNPAAGLFGLLARNTASELPSFPRSGGGNSNLFESVQTDLEKRAKLWRETGRCEQCGTELSAFERLAGYTRCVRHR